MRILVIEDSATIQRYYSSELTREKVDHDIAASRVEAISCLRNRSYHGAIVDLSLTDDPNYTQGQEILEYMQKQNEGTKAIVVSASPHSIDARDSYRRGVEDFIIKGETSFQEIAKSFVKKCKNVELDLFGGKANLVAYLANPEIPPYWEDLVARTLATDFGKMQHGIAAAFREVLPVLRPIERNNPLTFDKEKKCAYGKFWSKALGCTVMIAIGTDESQLRPEVLKFEGILLNENVTAKSVFSKTWKLEDMARSEFPEFIHQHPWAQTSN